MNTACAFLVSVAMSNERIPWQDRFNRPSVRDLRGSLVDEARTAFDRTVRHLRSLVKDGETVGRITLRNEQRLIEQGCSATITQGGG